MIVLDTNVLSEPLRIDPDPVVLAWLATQPDAIVAAISVGELLTGVARLPQGTRRRALTDGIERLLDASTVLPYDDKAARQCARLQQSRRELGRPLAVEDGMIAATCLAHGATLATRNTHDFEYLGLTVINPWLNRS